MVECGKLSIPHCLPRGSCEMSPTRQLRPVTACYIDSCLRIGLKGVVEQYSVITSAMWEPVALCCFSRRTGCLVLGALELVGAISRLLAGAYIMILGEFKVFHHTICRIRHMGVPNCEMAVEEIAKPIIIVLMVLAVVQLVCASMMIHGIRKNDHCLMCPFLIKNAILVVVDIVIAVIGVILMLIAAIPLGILGAYCFGPFIFMWTYFLLTVRAYYYELKRGKAGNHHRLTEQSDMEISPFRE